MQIADRVKQLSSAIFSEMDTLKVQAQSCGVDVINLSVGSPDRPPAGHIIEALQQAVMDTSNYGYALTEGMPEFKEAVAYWYKHRFNVDLDSQSEVLSLMGSQDGIAHIFWAILNHGDTALVPDPGYPIYHTGVLLAGGNPYYMPLTHQNAFLPDLDAIPTDIAKKAKMMLLNYPNNPVAAIATYEFFEKVVAFAKKYNIIVCHDVAYSELAFDGFKPMSFLEIPGAKEVGVEFHSVSKTYNMAGCRLAYVVGNAIVIDALRKIKSNIDYGVFKPIQIAGIAALLGPQDWIIENAAAYQRRRDIFIKGVKKAGWHIDVPKASMFLWSQLPFGYEDAGKFAVDLLQKAGVCVVPGTAFGKEGKGYVRIALVADEIRMQEAVERINRASF